MDSHFLESLGIAETKFDRPFNQRRMQRNLARALRERASQGLDPSQDDEQKATFIEGLKSKIQDKKSSWQGQEDVLGAIKTRTKNAMDGKRDHTVTLINELSSLSQDERKLTIRNQLQDRFSDSGQLAGLQERLSDGIISFKAQGVTSDALKEIKAQTTNAMASKRENAKALIDEYECLPINERIPALRAEFSSRIQDLSSNPVMTALSGNDGSFFEGIIRRNPATFVDL